MKHTHIQSFTTTMMVVILLAGVGGVFAGNTDSVSPDGQEPLDGFWPTQRMVDALVRRWARQSASEFDLRPDQQADVEDKLLKRWSSFLRENRRDMQPLINEYLETRLSLEPPTSEQITRWANRVMPVYQKLRTNIEDGETEIRSVMDAHQQAKFDVQRLKRNLGLQYFEAQLNRWRTGHFEQREWWDPPRGYKPPQPSDGQTDKQSDAVEERRIAERRNEQVPDRVTNELGAWEEYVANFCDTFDLDRSQRNAAQSMLREMLEQARDHVYARRDRMVALEHKIANPVGIDADEVTKELEELYGPLDRMFHELDERLNKLPMSSQRRQAGKDN